MPLEYLRFSFLLCSCFHWCYMEFKTKYAVSIRKTKWVTTQKTHLSGEDENLNSNLNRHFSYRKNWNVSHFFYFVYNQPMVVLDPASCHLPNLNSVANMNFINHTTSCPISSSLNLTLFNSFFTSHLCASKTI